MKFIRAIFLGVLYFIIMSVSSCTSNDFHEHIGVPEAYGTIFYSGNKNMDKALSYLSGCDVSSLKNGTYQIDPGKITITVSDNSLRSESDAKLESHRSYADIQIVISGTERFGLADVKNCKSVAVPYDSQKDIEFFNDAPERHVELSAGQMIILPPDCAHMPLLGEGNVRKCVVKVFLAEYRLDGILFDNT